jgi:hypothetical protein
VTQFHRCFFGYYTHKPNLKELNLSITSLGDDFVTIFANGLYYNTQLEKLALIGSGYLHSNTSVCAKALANALSHNETLSELDLLNNPSYGDDCAGAIANANAYKHSVEDFKSF